MTRVLVVTAIDLEAPGFARHLGADTRVERPRLAVCPTAEARWTGLPGTARAAHLDARAARRQSSSLVVGAGVCGALYADLPGDLVVPEAVVAATRRVATGDLPSSGAPAP